LQRFCFGVELDALIRIRTLDLLRTILPNLGAHLNTVGVDEVLAVVGTKEPGCVDAPNSHI